MKEQNPSVNRLYSAKPNSTTDRTPHCRWSLLSMLVFRVFLSGCSSSPGEAVGRMAPSPLEYTFDRYEVATDVAKHQTVLTGFLLGGAIAELAVVSIDANGDPRTRIYVFEDDAWATYLDTTLRRDVLFVDVANIDGRDRLITYEPGRLNWFDPESATEHALVTVTSNFNPPRSDEIPHVDLTRDLNNDGRDDLVVPDVDGFRVFIQTSDGAFASAVKVGSRTEMAKFYGDDGYRYNPWGRSGIHETDYNRDGRSDLVYWNDDRFEVHYQDEYGLFAPDTKTFTTDVSFDSDAITSLVAPHGVRQRRKDHQPVGGMEGRVLHSLTDQNGDGIADLVVFSLKGGSLWRMHSTYEVHFGAPTPDGTVFAPDVGTAIESDGIPFGLGQHDLDHDGQVDMMITTIKPRLLKAIGMIVGSLLTGSGSLDLEFYSMDGSVYPDKPSATRKVRSYPGDSGEKTAHLSVLIGDVNGDRRSDLLIQHSWEELRVYLGVPGKELFSQRPQKIKVTMPNEEYTWLVDFNRDGKQDLLMHHPSTTEPHRVTMLIAQ